MAFYLIDVQRGIQPDLRGPYETEATRDAAAKQLREQQADDDALFWLNVSKEGKPVVGPYSGGFFKN